MQRLVSLAGHTVLVVALLSCAPAPRPLTVPEGGALVVSRLYLEGRAPARPDLPFLFGGREGVQASLSLQSLSRNRLGLSVRCDGPARLRDTRRGGDPSVAAVDARLGGRASPPAWAAADTPLRASLAPRSRGRLVLDLGPEVARCALRVQPSGADSYTLSLEREERARPRLHAREVPPAAKAQPQAPRPAAAFDVATGDRLAAAFHAERALAMTAALGADRLRLLGDGKKALNARIEALTGARVPKAALAGGDPTLPLDFSNAPQLDAIYLSYLILAADFSGALTARMLAWHAERGAVVRILVTDALLSGPDRAFFEKLAARYPTVQLQPFRFSAGLGDSAEEHAARLHRTNHAKLFMTLARDPSSSRAIIGGRNLHESYLFREPRDLSAFPQLRQYFSEFDWSWLEFHPFEDIEVELTAPDLIDEMAVQFAALWHRDHGTGRPFDWPPPTAAAAAAVGSRQGVLARHFLSLPWADGGAQERLVVDLFDAADESIEIATPFVNLTPRIEAALERAVARGVSVRVVTTMERGGLHALVTNHLHRVFARDWAGRLALHDFREGDVALHAKLFVLDRRLAMVTSTNLNQRSFVHDIENGLMVMDRRFAARMAAVIDDYIARGQPVTDAEPGPGAAALLMGSSWSRRAF